MDMIGPSTGEPGTVVVFVRHCRTAWNREGRFMGHRDLPLDELGLQQAQCLPVALEGWGITRILCSPLQRARQTADPIGRRLTIPVSEDERWRELDMGSLEGLTWSEVEKTYPSFSRMRQERPEDVKRPGGGESDRQLQERAAAAFSEVVSEHPGETSLVVSHGGTIKSVLSWLISLPLREKWRLSTYNGSVNVVRRTERGWQIDLLNYVDHLRHLR